MSRIKAIRIRQCIFILLSLVCMWMIFYMSSRDGVESANDSEIIGRIIGEHFIPGFKTWSEGAKNAFASGIDYYVRKAAHGTEFALLSCFLTGVFVENELKYKCFFMAWLTATMYAVTDEFHQLFIEGRSGQISDVIIDSIGALAGVLFIFIMIKLSKGIISFYNHKVNCE